MSSIAKATGAAIEVQRAPTLEQLAEFVDKPLRQLPTDWRAPVWDFWSFWSHLLPTQLSLATRLRQWRAGGLTLERMREAFERINRPERAAQFRFAGDLLAALAGEIAGQGVDPERAAFLAKVEEEKTAKRK